MPTNSNQPIEYLAVRKWPISRYQEGEWHFVEEFDGTNTEAHKRADLLQRTNKDGEYRIWDPR